MARVQKKSLIRKPPPAPPEAVRRGYDRLGPEEYYRQHGGDYVNPHEPTIRKILSTIVPEWGLDCSRTLDLAAGAGEITRALLDQAAALKLSPPEIEGMDPYTGAAYQARTGRVAEAISFEEICDGALSGRRYSLVVCSFAMHLFESSRLPTLLYRLAEVAPALLILSPHKRPQIKEAWGWTLRRELLQLRVRARLYG